MVKVLYTELFQDRVLVILIFICPIYITEMRVKALADIEVVNLTDRFFVGLG